MGDSKKKLHEHLPSKSTMDHQRFTKKIHMDDGRVFGWINESQLWEDVNTGSRITDVELQNLQFSIVEAATQSQAAAAASASASAASSSSSGDGAGPKSLNQNLLVNGSGFLTNGTGDSEDLGFVGTSSMQGYTASPIVAWTEMPYLTREEDFYVTLSAHHINDIDKVEFALNGGATATVRRKGCPVPHPVWGTEHNEYYVKVPAASMASGYNEVRAVVYPKTAGKIVRLEGRTEAFYTDGAGVVQLGTTFDHSGKTGNGDITISRYVCPNNIQQELLSGGAGYKGHNPQGAGIAAEGFYFNTNTTRKKYYVDPGYSGTQGGGITNPYQTIQAVFENEWTTVAKCKENADMAVYLKTPSGSGVSGGLHQWPRANFGCLNSSVASNTDRAHWSNAATGGSDITATVEKVVDIIGLSDTPTATDGTQYVHMRGYSGGNPEAYTDGAGVVMHFGGGSSIQDLNVRFKDLWVKPDFAMSGFQTAFHGGARLSLAKIFLDGMYMSRGNTYQDRTNGIQQKVFPIQNSTTAAEWPGGIYCFNNRTWGTAYIAKGCKLAKHNEHIRQKGDMYPQSPGALIANMWHIHGGASDPNEVHSDLWQYSNAFHMRNRIIAGNKVANCNGQLGHMSFGKTTRYRDNAAGINFDSSRRHAYGYIYPNENFAHVDNQFDCPESSHNMNIGGVIDHFVIDRNALRNSSYSFTLGTYSFVGGSAITPKYQGNPDLGGMTMGSTAFGQSGGHSGPHFYRNFRFTNNQQGKWAAAIGNWHKLNPDSGQWGTGETLTVYSGAQAITWGDIFDHTSSRCSNNHIVKEKPGIKDFFKVKDPSTTFGEVVFRRCRPDFNWCGSTQDAQDWHRAGGGQSGENRPIGCPTDIRDIAHAPSHSQTCPTYYMPHIYTGDATVFRDTNLAYFSPLAGGTAYRNMSTTHDFYTAYPPEGPFGVFDLWNDKTALTGTGTVKPIDILHDVIGATHWLAVEDVFGFTSSGGSGGSAAGDSNRVGADRVIPYEAVHANLAVDIFGSGVGVVAYNEGNPGAKLDAATLQEISEDQGVPLDNLPVGDKYKTRDSLERAIADIVPTAQEIRDVLGLDHKRDNTGNTKLTTTPTGTKLGSG